LSAGHTCSTPLGFAQFADFDTLSA
jgi:hypothetical protein